MTSTKEMQLIEANNNALKAFAAVHAIVICDDCMQDVIADNDWIQPELYQNYAKWAEHNHTVILLAKVRKPYKRFVENAVGILKRDSSMP